MLDVLIVGAGPAGTVAASVLARAGARVRILDRASFPRDKLCGDTLNPGTLRLLRRLGLGSGIAAGALRIDGMLVTGAGGVSIEGRYPENVHGLSISRRDLDWQLLQEAVAAGASFDERIAVRAALVEDRRGTREVQGVVVGANGSTSQLRARVVIAADGRRSTLAFGLRLARHPRAPRRWAIGAYFESLGPAQSIGEMHIRPGRYIGVAPVPGGLMNVCVVKPAGGGDCAFRDPGGLLSREMAAEPVLRERFTGRRPVRPPVMIGPLAVDVTDHGIDGLILAGDAAGFVDPMTGDGLRFAVRGGELAAGAALEALQQGWHGVHARLAARRHREFAAKWRFNRGLRALVSSPFALRGAAAGARMAPGLVRRLVARAGDCDVVTDGSSE